MTHGSVAEEIARIVGPGQLFTGSDIDERYCTDILRKSRSTPGLVVRPSSTEELSRIVRVAACRRIPVTPLGGGTGLVGGAVADEGGILLSLERMNAVEVDGAAMTIVAGAGATIEAVQQAAEREGLMLPLDLGARGSATVGGAISTNAGGTRVLRWGMMREMVLGVEAVLADGAVVSSLRHYLKDNAGYDWKHLLIGSEGTLGIVTSAVLRLWPAPRSVQTALLATRSVAEAAAILRFMQARLAGRLSSFELLWRNFYAFVSEAQLGKRPRPLPPDHGMYILVEALGDDEDGDQAIFSAALEQLLADGLIDDAVVAQSEQQRADLWAVREDLLEPMAQIKPRFAYDVSMALPLMEAFVDDAERRVSQELPGALLMFYGHGGDGNLHVAVGPGTNDVAAEAKSHAAVYGAVQAVGGSISAEHGIGRYKRGYISASRSPAELDVMRRMKSALDPLGILNPGKVIPD